VQGDGNIVTVACLIPGNQCGEQLIGSVLEMAKRHAVRLRPENNMFLQARWCAESRRGTTLNYYNVNVQGVEMRRL
jgi:hypothetical protein